MSINISPSPELMYAASQLSIYLVDSSLGPIPVYQSYPPGCWPGVSPLLQSLFTVFHYDKLHRPCALRGWFALVRESCYDVSQPGESEHWAHYERMSRVLSSTPLVSNHSRLLRVWLSHIPRQWEGWECFKFDDSKFEPKLGISHCMALVVHISTWCYHCLRVISDSRHVYPPYFK